MAALGNLNIVDGAAVNHVFTHRNHNGKDFIWADSTAGLTSMSAPIYQVSVLPAKDKNLERYRQKVSIPAMETLLASSASGYQAAPKVAYSLGSICDYLIPTRATLAQRKDLVAFTTGSTGNAQIQDILYYGNLPY